MNLLIPVLVVASTVGFGENAYGQAASPGKSSADEHAAPLHLICGVILKVNRTNLELQTRTGKIIQVDAAKAIKAQRSVALREGLAVAAEGTVDKAGSLQAETINRIKSSRTLWPEDR
jgi:hypothetical protein